MPKKKSNLRSQNTGNLGVYSQRKKTSDESKTELHSIPSPTSTQTMDNADSGDDIFCYSEPVRARREVRLLSEGPRERRRKVSSIGNDGVTGGNRILPIKNLQEELEKELVCKKCASSSIDGELDQFATYCDNQPNVTGIRELLDRYKKIRPTLDTPPVKVTEETVGIATTLKCSCDAHGTLFRTKVSKTNYKNNKNGYKSYESFALNCMLVLSMQQVGAAGSETDRLLSFLNLPNANAFRRDRFKSVEDSIGREIRKYSNKIIEEAIDEEVLLTLTKQNREESFQLWKDGLLDANSIKIKVSYDMGWNKRSSGNKYDSTSGHGIVIGALSKKILAVKTYSRSCVVCNISRIKPPPPHNECPKNHEGTPKSMEVRGIVEIFIEFWNEKRVGIETIISDDDSTMRSQLKNKYADLIAAGKLTDEQWPRYKGRNGTPGAKKPCKGMLPIHMKPPSFLADPNHRVKVFGKHVYMLARASKKESDIDSSIAQRMKEYWGKALAQIKTLHPVRDKELIVKKGKAPLEHLFDVHEYCGDWCYKKKALEEGKDYVPPDNRPFLSKTDNSRAYNQIQKVVQKFSSFGKLCESIHDGDTQKNEALNTAIARVAPKFKHFGGTMTLPTRINLVAGITNIGYREFYMNLFSILGVSVADLQSDLIVGITRYDSNKRKNYERKISVEYKRQRRHKIKAKIREQVYNLRVSERENYGDYSSGYVFCDDEDINDNQRPSIINPSTTNANRTMLANDLQGSSIVTGTQSNKSSIKFCKWCNKNTNHTTWRSKHCVAYSQYMQQRNNNSTQLTTNPQTQQSTSDTVDITPPTIDSLTATNEMAVANDMAVAVGGTSDDIDIASIIAKMKNSDV